ncbi:MAG: cation:proton antiporter [Pirellulaceae bacterium]
MACSCWRRSARLPCDGHQSRQQLLYLCIGAGIGPWGLDLLRLDLVRDAELIEVLTEIGVLVSLLGAGLKLVPSWTRFRQSPIPLASVTMVLTILGVTAVGYGLLALPLGAAMLLGAVLAPTDPVLASEVEVTHKNDTDKLRYSLTGEAGLNDGTAFPFIMLGLGWLGLHDLGYLGWRWFLIDFVWAIGAGLGVGAIVGCGISHLFVWVKRSQQPAAICEELLTLSMMGLAYGGALAIASYGFLAVFASGVSMRRFADRSQDTDGGEQADVMIRSVANVNEYFGEVLEVALVLIIGVLLASAWTLPKDWWIALIVFGLLRPIATFAALFPTDVAAWQQGLIAFFGIRGIGSMYYLSYAIGEGLEPDLALRLGGIVLTTISISLLIHSNIASLVLRVYQTRMG